MSDKFEMPELNVGDMVYWYSDPLNPQTPSMGWVSRRPGVQTITILIWAEDAGLVEKPSVRHVDDPFWVESQSAASWTKWGAFRPHPTTAMLRQVVDIAKSLKLQAARTQKPKDAA
jgi:hypothetical protein